MKVLNPQLDLEWYFKRLAASEHSVLCLDYDGTLAPFRPERDRAVPYQGVGERLARLVKLKSTRLVIISGRWSQNLKPLLGLKQFPEIWGCHGGERVLPDGTVHLRNIDEKTIEGLVAVDEWARVEGLADQVERKPTSVAFHWRGLPGAQAGRIRELIYQVWGPEADRFKLAIHEFDGGLELRVKGIDKGEAVRGILEETDSNTPVAYLGDDKTDEDAFAALPISGLKVLVRKELRRTRADLWIAPPEELLQFLDRWIRSSS